MATNKPTLPATRIAEIEARVERYNNSSLRLADAFSVDDITDLLSHIRELQAESENNERANYSLLTGLADMCDKMDSWRTWSARLVKVALKLKAGNDRKDRIFFRITRRIIICEGDRNIGDDIIEKLQAENDRLNTIYKGTEDERKFYLAECIELQGKNDRLNGELAELKGD